MIDLLSVNTATVAQHLRGLGHKLTDHSLIVEPLKSRSLTVQAKVCRSEMTVSQKNINFGRSTVGEQNSWSISISNLSDIPLLYSINKSGSISSGFLFFSSGRHGEVPPHSTAQVEIIFKPSLPGPFEEELKIHNVLNPQNSQSVIIKAKVLKPESFSLRVGQTDVGHMHHSHEYDGVHLGEVMIGEYSRVFSFVVRNITNKSRQFIVDASQHDAVNLDFEAAAAMGLGSEDVFTVCAITCNFEESLSDRLLRRSRISEEEREQLEDKLEWYNQKLKIGIRKRREDKISKYRKKIESTRAYLEGDADTLEGERDSDEEKENNKEQKTKTKFEENGNDPAVEDGASDFPKRKLNDDFATDGVRNLKVANLDEILPPNLTLPTYIEEPFTSHNHQLSTSQSHLNYTLVGNSTSAFHFHIPAESETEIKVKITFLPGTSYVPWTGTLLFRGYLRIFESKNEDIVKNIYFDALVASNKAPLTTYDAESSQALCYSPRKRRVSDPPLNHAGALIAAVAQWSAYPTKQLYPRYRSMPQNMLGMAVKLIPIGHSRVLQGSFSISSTCEESGQLRIRSSVDSPIIGKHNEYESYDPSDHGQVDFSLAPNYDSEFPEVADFCSELELPLPPSSSRTFLVQWQPAPHHKKLMILGSVRIEFRGSYLEKYILYVPFVGVLENKSIISVDKYVNLGFHAVGSKKKASFTIRNRSDSEHLHYVTMVVSVAQSKNAVGKITLTSSRTGVIPPLSSKAVEFTFISVALGKFEQQVWVGNLNDRFDQKRMTIRANVIVPEFKLVLFPQLELNEDGMPMPLNFGLIQVSSNPRVQSPDFVYRLRMINISNKVLLVTAVSNLKKQCFVFCDKDHKISAILHEMPPSSTSYLYFVIRPASLVLSNDTSRELVGGIRLLFASLDPLAPIIMAKSISECAPSEEDVEEYNKGHKLFERSLVFNAYIGSSTLKLRSCNKPSDHGIISLNSTYLWHRGTLQLENLSHRFPSKYVFVQGMCVPLGAEGIRGFLATSIVEKCFFVINDIGEGELLPGQILDFEYYFVAEEGSGLLLQKIVVLNMSTGVECSLNLSAPFPGKDVDFSIISSNASQSQCIVWMNEMPNAFSVAKRQLATGKDLVLMEGILKNLSDHDKSVIPYSDLPLEVHVDSTSSEHADAVGYSIITGLSKCGSLIVLAPKSSTKCMIIGKGEISKNTLDTHLISLISRGSRSTVSGKITWVSADDSAADTQQRYESLFLTTLPICGSTAVEFDIQCTNLKLTHKRLALGKLKSNRQVHAQITIENITDAVLPMKLSNIHPWMKITKEPGVVSENTDPTTMHFLLEPKENCGLQVI